MDELVNSDDVQTTPSEPVVPSVYESEQPISAPGNESPQPSPISVVPQEMPVYVEPNQGAGLDSTFKVWKWKYVLIIFGVTLVYDVARYLSYAQLVIYVAGIILAFVTLSKFKKDPTTATSETEKLKAVGLMALSPLMVQAIFYYGLQKSNPQLAKEYNKLGWKVIGLQILFSIVLFALGFVVAFAYLALVRK